jgi:hypothetical protein
MVIEGYEITKCPMKFVSEFDSFRIEAFTQYKNGFLPDEGGWLDQPMKFIQLMGLIGGIVTELEKREIDGKSTA